MQAIENAFIHFSNTYYDRMKANLKYQNKLVRYFFTGFIWIDLIIDVTRIFLFLLLHKVCCGGVVHWKHIFSIYFFYSLVFLEIAFLFISSLISPGYCADMNDEKDVEEVALLNKPNSSSTVGSICQKCGLKRPLRSCHCSECDRCIVRFDHHNILINNCIGYGNQHYFLLFIICGLLGTFTFISELVQFDAQKVSANALLVIRFCIFAVISVFYSLFLELKVTKFMYLLVQLRIIIPNVLNNITHYEAINSFKIGYLKDERFRFFNPFDKGMFKNIIEFFHLSEDWMSTHYYCLMDIPNHPLRVKGLQYLQQNNDHSLRKSPQEPKLEVVTCPKCGIQLYRPKDVVSIKCTCGHVFAVKL